MNGWRDIYYHIYLSNKSGHVLTLIKQKLSYCSVWLAHWKTNQFCPSEYQLGQDSSWSVKLNCMNPLLTPSVTSRISGWTCWDTRGKLSVQPSNSGPIWCRGRWRCDIHPQSNLCHGSVVFTFLCLSGLVSYFSGAHLKPKQKENSLSSATLYSDESNTATRRNENETGLSASHLRQITEERCTMEATVQVKVRLGCCWGEGELLWCFH